jgi:molybdopterin converting factor small subunit
MMIPTLLFASYADALGRERIDVEVPSGATVNDLIASLRELDHQRRLPPSPLVAVNARYARRDQVLVPGDEVAVIPPVAGG